VAVYIRCVGDGGIRVQLGDIATYEQACEGDAQEGGTMNLLEHPDLRDGPFTVTGSADAADVWAVAVTDAAPR
jgi:hypothetical protein